MSDNDTPDSRAVEYNDIDDGFKDRFDNIPFESPLAAQQLRLEDEIQFNCHPGISCFNACCKSIDIQLMPYDIIRLKKNQNMDSREFVARFTVPFEMDHHAMPGLKLAAKPHTTECVFLSEAGCTVYEDRPTACRYYAVGSMGMRKTDTSYVEDQYFLVKEDHCKGHFENLKLTIGEYRKQQKLEHYDAMNSEWRDIIIKKRSSGPSVGAPSARSLQLFDLCSYDMDSMKGFVQSDSFKELFDIEVEEINQLVNDEEKLLAFAMRFLKQTLFGEKTIAMKENARNARLAKRKETITKRKQQEAGERDKDRVNTYDAIENNI